MPIHLENWLWADIDYDVSLVQFILRVDQLKDPANWHRIGTGLADWHRIGRLAPDWQKIDRLAPDWPIGTGLAWFGTDWQIGEFVSEQNIGPRLAVDWHGLARIGTDWHGMANWRIFVGAKNWPPIGTGLARIGTDWHGLTWIGTD